MTATAPGMVHDLLKVLWAAFPQVNVARSTEAVYVRSLQDFTEDEIRRAINVAVATSSWLPTVAALRDLVMEERLQLPSPDEAWELVKARVSWKPSAWRPCIACAGLGTRLYEAGDDQRPAEDRLCESCHGRGEVPVGTPPSLDEVTQRALDFVGGSYEVRGTREPGILRAQFLKAHASFRNQALREANLIGLGVLQPAASRVALEAGESAAP